MKGYVSTRIGTLAASLFLAFSAPLPAEDDDYTISVLEYQNMRKSAMQAYKDKDYEEAFPDLYQMAVWGEKDCQWTLGLMYFEGKGVDENVLEAYAWMKTAAESGVEDWVKTVERLADALPDNAIDYANQYADDYIRRYGMEATGIQCSHERGGGRGGVKSRRKECHRPSTLTQTLFRLPAPVEPPES